MGKYISLGEYNQQYKYIWIYLIIRFIYVFVFTNRLVFDQIKSDLLDFPYGPFIYPQLDYLAYIIISAFLIIIQKCFIKTKLIKDSNDKQLIFHNIDITDEYGVEQNDYFLFINLIFVVLVDLFSETLYNFNCTILYYWMFEMLYYEYFHSRIFKTKIYRHHIFSLIFILSFCSLFRTIYIIIDFTNDTDDAKFFQDRKWLIPIGIVIYLIFPIFRTFAFSNEKYYLEKRVISIENYMLFYGIFGFTMCFIGAIISTFVPCGDNTIPELSKIVCEIKENNTTYYFDSYTLYFEELFSNNFSRKFILLIIKSILNYAIIYFIYIIFQKLSPIYYICMHRLCNLIITLLTFINDLINDDNYSSIDITLEIFYILLLLFYIFGSIVYLEFIELNFCNLNFYTRRKIRTRAKIDINIMLDDISANSESIN